MQEFVTVPTYLIRELSEDKLYALMDILSMADENGEVCISVRRLMNRWKWGNTKVVNFIKFLERQDICKTQTRHKQDTVLTINSMFFGSAKDVNKTQTRHKQDAKTTKITMKNSEELQKVLEAWNELSDYGIEPIPQIGISSMQYQNLKSIAEKYGIEDIIKTIQRIKISDFLQGKIGNGWRITFNWFIKDGNYQKVQSGKYDGVNNATEKGGDSKQPEEDEELIGDEWVDL